MPHRHAPGLHDAEWSTARAPMLSIIPVARIMTEEMAMVGHA